MGAGRLHKIADRVRAKLRLAASPAKVTVCIPAYKSGAFIAETLEAVRCQTYPHFRVQISIDGPDPATEETCRRFTDADPRFRVTVQKRRLGWLANTNAALDCVATEFFFILPHDDFITPDYIETLLAEAQSHPEAIVVFCDMERIGWRHDFRSTPNLDGTFRSRLTSLLTAPAEAVAWRGLTRSSVLKDGRRMRPNRFEDYNAHALWVVELLCLGPFQHVPRALYRQWERVADTSVTTGWRSWPPERRYAGMAEYTLQCVETVSARVEVDAEERQAIVLLLVLRLLTHPATTKPFPSHEKAGDRNLIRAAELIGRASGLPYLEQSSADELRQDPQVRRFMAELRLKDAIEDLSVNDLNAAATTLDAAAALDPHNGQVQLRRAQLMRRRGDLDSALEAIGVANQLLPSDAGVQMEATNIHLQAGDLASALHAAEKAVAFNPQLANAHYYLSQALSRNEHFDRALQAATTCLALDPKHAKCMAHADKLKSRLAMVRPSSAIGENCE